MQVVIYFLGEGYIDFSAREHGGDGGGGGVHMAKN